ncbi:unnamed protein product [Blepharisma stoltei]|uniref:Uncharacterized protein n=1 Tax=Blepharisma stoltei TaxID=1481888 RepID=A0AAU9K0J6_9CILI|nr:unnamed protein product [Blepharisma stoltei]
MANCCEGLSKVLTDTWKGFFKFMIYGKNQALRCCACWWYPIKECYFSCYICCDKRYNPYKDDLYAVV